MKDTFSVLILSQNVTGPSHWPAYGEMLRLIGALQYFTPALTHGTCLLQILLASVQVTGDCAGVTGVVRRDRGRRAGCQGVSHISEVTVKAALG